MFTVTNFSTPLLKYLIAGLLFLNVSMNAAFCQVELAEQIRASFQQGNPKEISKHFASTIYLSILTGGDIYSKIQAEHVLKDFFDRYKPASSKILQRLESNPDYRICVLELKTKLDKFKAILSFKINEERFFITEMRIEAMNQ